MHILAKSDLIANHIALLRLQRFRLVVSRIFTKHGLPTRRVLSAKKGGWVWKSKITTQSGPKDDQSFLFNLLLFSFDVCMRCCSKVPILDDNVFPITNWHRCCTCIDYWRTGYSSVSLGYLRSLGHGWVPYRSRFIPGTPLSISSLESSLRHKVRVYICRRTAVLGGGLSLSRFPA